MNLKRYTQESISQQLHDPLVDDILNELSSLREYVHYYDVTNGYSLYKYKEPKAIITKIDTLLSNRFNIPIKHLYSTNVFASLPIKHDTDNGLVTNVKDILKDLETNAKICKNDATCDITVEPVSLDTIADVSRICDRSIKNSKDLIKSISKGEVVIDREHATIKGVKLKNPMYIIMDYLTLFKQFELTDREIVAITLHEVGHLYTHIEYMYTSTNLDIANMENIRESLTKAIPSDVTLALKQIDSVYGESIEVISDANKLYATNSEEVADLFATRFGLGDELVSGLNKVETIYIDLARLTMITTIYSIITYISIYAFLLGPIIGSLMYAGVLLYMAFKTLYDILTISHDGNATTYDSNYDRFRRIRNSIIAMVRSGAIDKKTSKQLIGNIDTINTIIDELPGKGIIESISDKMPWHTDGVNYHRRERILEDLLDNQLHIKTKR